MGLFGRKRGGDEPGSAADDAYLGLRRLALNVTAASLGSACTPGAPVVALLMESRYDRAVATLVGIADGTTSLYFSNGGGVIGAGSRRDVAEATHRWLELCGGLLEHFWAVDDPPLPPEDVTQFVAVTSGGRLSALASKDDLGQRRHPLAPLYYAGHQVITQIRLTEAA
jgi:hypothetical protein